MSEIDCPADCPYLSTSKTHPPAMVRRQQERDVGLLLPTLRGLTERQHQLFFLFQSLVAQHPADGLVRLVDADVAEAASACAATLETAARGVIYDHNPETPSSQRLATALKAMLADMREQGATVYDREAAIVLRALERGARELGKGDSRSTAYLDLMARLLRQSRGHDDRARPKPATPLILP